MIDRNDGDLQKLANAFAARLPRPGLITSDPVIVEPHCQDYRGWYRGPAIALARPKSVDDVQRVLQTALELGCAVIPQGGNTSLCGGAVPLRDQRPSVVLSLVGLNAIRAIDGGSWSMIAEAGCTIVQLQDAAKSAGRHFGLDLGSRASASIGGALATNAGGMSVVRYGTCRELTLGLEVVLPDGSLCSGLKVLRKDNSGFDLKHLFIGSEGLLGVITAASLKLHPEEKNSATALVRLSSLLAANAFADLAMGMADGGLSALELMPAMGVRRTCGELLRCRPPIDLAGDWYVLFRLAGQQDVQDRLLAIVSSGLERGHCADAVIAQSQSQENNLWTIRDSFSDLHKCLGASIRFDYAVPLGQVPELYARLCDVIARIEPGFVPFAFGHLGDGNLHFSACQPEQGDAAAFTRKKPAIEAAANEVVWSLGGTVSAEHGIGQLHRDELQHQKSETELAIMRRLKAALDPDGMMNPGKFLPA